MSACDKCDPVCAACKGDKKKCIACPPGQYSTDEINGGTCVNIESINSIKLITIIESLIILLILLIFWV